MSGYWINWMMLVGMNHFIQDFQIINTVVSEVLINVVDIFSS